MKLLNFERNNIPFDRVEKYTGIINPINWDNDGKPTRFSIYTVQEEDVILENKKFDKKLRRLVGKKVEVLGRPKLNDRNEKALFLLKIKQIGNGEGNSQNNPGSPSYFEDEFPFYPPHQYASRSLSQFF